MESGAEIEGFTLETVYGENVVLTKTVSENGDTSVNSGNYAVTNEYEEEEELIEIPDEEPPLADIPKTGDMFTVIAGMAIVSGAAAILTAKSGKKEDEE